MTRSQISCVLVALAVGLVAALSVLGLRAQPKQEDLEGVWETDVGDQTVEFKRQGDQYAGYFVKVPSAIQSLFKVGDQVNRGLIRTGPNSFKGEGLWRYTSGREEWLPTVLTIKDGRMTPDPPSSPPRVYIRTSRKPTAGCLPTFDGTWHDLGPSGGGREDPGRELGTWGKWTFQQNGNDVTGTIDNVGGAFGKSTIKGTVSGKTFSGTWTADNGSGNGMVTATRSDDDCRFTTTWSVDKNSTGQTVDTGGRTVCRCPERTSSSTGGDFCQIPGVERCIQKWMDMRAEIMNRLHPGKLPGSLPWTHNQYGMLVGGGPTATIASSGAPDDFYTRYHGSKYCMVWAICQGEHNALWNHTAEFTYGGELPALKTFVDDCCKQSGDCAPVSTGTGTTEPPFGDGMTLLADNLQVPKGFQNFVVYVKLKNAKDVKNLDVSLGYNTDIVAARSGAEKGSVVSNIWESNLSRAGLFQFSFAQLTPFNGDGSVAGFRFDALAVGQTPLNLSVSKGTKLPLTIVNGSITVYDPNKPPPGGPGTVNGPGGPGTINGPGGPGTFQHTCSGSGVQTSNDAQCCLQMWVKLKPENLYMDLDQSNEVDSNDALIVLQNVARGLQQ